MFWYQATRLARASASCRYRLGHFAERLAGATTIVDPCPPLQRLTRASVLVVVRPFVDDATRRLLEGCRERGVTLVADFDDLLFAGEPGDYPLVLSGSLDRASCARRIAIYREGLSLFDAFTVSTEALRDELLATVPEARVSWVPNGLSRAWVEQGRRLYRAWRPGDPKVIRFLSGSPSHDADLAEIAPLLTELLRARPEVQLELVGPVTVEHGALPGQALSFRAHLPYAELPRLLASSWVTIAPLRPSRFTRCKSALKFLESAAFGAPCVASPNPDATRHRNGGILLAPDERAWWEALTLLLDDDERMRVGAESRAYVEQRGDAAIGAGVLHDEVLRLDDEARGRP